MCGSKPCAGKLDGARACSPIGRYSCRHGRPLSQQVTLRTGDITGREPVLGPKHPETEMFQPKLRVRCRFSLAARLGIAFSGARWTNSSSRTGGGLNTAEFECWFAGPRGRIVPDWCWRALGIPNVHGFRTPMTRRPRVGRGSNIFNASHTRSFRLTESH